MPAHLLLAEIALDDRPARRGDARRSQKALKVNPNSLEARSLDAAIAFLEGADRATSSAQVAEILKINPRYGDVYRVAGDHAARNYRFDEAVELTRRALTLDPDSTRALRRPRACTCCAPATSRARGVALETAFKADPFDVVTYNLLSMLDTLDKFETITDGDIVMRLHPDEAAVMREYAMPLAKEALATLSKRYEFKPTGPILIEMFPKHDDFAVRTLGLPGHDRRARRLLRHASSRSIRRKARPPGEFSWEETLLARAGARHHAADVEQPHAALADRGHVGVRGARGHGRSGAARRTCRSRRRSSRARSSS